MRVEPDFRKRIGETRRYFPDWTHRSLASGPELEADHNSYLAGGYAEEFGYRAQPGYSRGAPVLDDETPERLPGAAYSGAIDTSGLSAAAPPVRGQSRPSGA